MPATTVAIMNFKGGVGKTTLSVNLAAALAGGFASSGKNYKVLLIDADAQSNATSYLLSGNQWEQRIYPNSNNTLFGAMDRYLKGDMNVDPRQYIITGKEYQIFPKSKIDTSSLHLLPAHFDLALLENLLASGGKGEVRPAGQASAIKVETLFNTVLGSLKNDYDYIIIDAPPNLYQVARNVLYYSENFIVPVVPDWLSTTGLVWFLKNVAYSMPLDGHTKSVRGIVPMIWDAKWKIHNEHKTRIIDAMKSKWEKDAALKDIVSGWKIFNGIPRVAEVGKMIDENLPLVENLKIAATQELLVIADYIERGWKK